MDYEKYLISEEKLDEGFMDAVMTGIGIGAGIEIFSFLAGATFLLAAGGVISAVKLKDKIKQHMKEVKSKKEAKEAHKWLVKSDTFKSLSDKMKSLAKAKKVKNKIPNIKQDFLKGLDKERMTIKRKLKSEVEDSSLSDEAKMYIYDMVPGLKGTGRG